MAYDNYNRKVTKIEEHIFQVGDRVQLTQPCLGIAAGTEGVITFIYPTVRNLYRVYFDGLDIAFSLASSSFERIESRAD